MRLTKEEMIARLVDRVEEFDLDLLHDYARDGMRAHLEKCSSKELRDSYKFWIDEDGEARA